MIFKCCALLVLVASTSGASNCDTKPMSLPIEDIQVVPDLWGSFMVGLRATVGTPAQDIVMLPWAELNNTWIYDHQNAGYCDDTIIFSDTICEVRRGQLFDESKSTSYDSAENMVAAGGASQEITGVTGEETGIASLLSTSADGAETLTVGSTNLSGYPIGIPRLNWDHGYTTLHALGLGSNSTYLNSLVQAGQIASRVWSIFWGRMWVDDWLNGSIVLGGYDSELVSGNNYTQALDYSNTTGCWTGMKVTITGITLNTRDGQDLSLLPLNTALPVCIVPQRQLLIEAPQSYMDTFQEVTGTTSFDVSYGLHWSAAQFLATDAYDGDMTISLSSGLSVRVANDQFMVPAITFDRNGTRVQNDTVKEFLFNGVGDQKATLGRYFLTAAYLMVNHESNTFTMWQSNPTTSSNLVAVIDQATEASCSNISGVVQPSATSTALSGANITNSGTTPVAAIAGGVTGGVIFIFAVVVAIFLVRRKRRAPILQLDPSELPASPGQAQQQGQTGQIQQSWQLQGSGEPKNESHELPPEYQPRPHEMLGNNVPIFYEMDGGHR